MIEFAIVQKWKHTAAPARIPTMSVDSTITFLNKTLVADDIVPVVEHRTFSDVIPEIRFRHLVSWIQVHPEVERSVMEIGTVHPLAVNPPMVIIITSGRYTLASLWSTVELSVESRITLGVFQTKTGFVAFSYLFATISSYEII